MERKLENRRKDRNTEEREQEKGGTFPFVVNHYYNETDRTHIYENILTSTKKKHTSGQRTLAAQGHAEKCSEVRRYVRDTGNVLPCYYLGNVAVSFLEVKSGSCHLKFLVL